MKSFSEASFSVILLVVLLIMKITLFHRIVDFIKEKTRDVFEVGGLYFLRGSCVMVHFKLFFPKFSRKQPWWNRFSCKIANLSLQPGNHIQNVSWISQLRNVSKRLFLKHRYGFCNWEQKGIFQILTMLGTFL